ncbi:MAG TPA: hypothetical protein VF707_05995 [Ardenticatenaceae bacterium]
MRYTRWLGVLLALAAVLLVGSIAWAQGDVFSINFWTVDGGGGTSGDGTYTVSGTIGQPDAGTMRSSDGVYAVEGGFWRASAGPLAALLAGFSAEGAADHVLLRWETVSEQGNAGFHLWRGASSNAPEVTLTEALIPSEAQGSSEGFSYSWVDRDMQVGTTYYYWLEAVGTDGATQRFGPVSASVQAPTSITLGEVGAAPAPARLWLLASLGLTLLAGGWMLRRR